MSKRLRKSILKRWAAFTWRHHIRVVKRGGVLWLLDHRNFVDRQLGVFGDFEPEQRAFLFSRSSSQLDAFLDIGANFGLYTVEAVHKKIAKQFYAFEPDPRNHAQLFANLYLNKQADKVVVYREAVSDMAGEVRIVLHSSETTGTTRVDSNNSAAVSVPSIAIDDVLPLRNKTLLIKIDIEGHELAALRGMEKLLRNNSCYLQVEIFDDNMQAVTNWLNQVGYKQEAQIDSDFYFKKAA